MVVVKTHNIKINITTMFSLFINKENTISKHKVNMTIISLVKNMTIKLQSILK